MTTDEVVIASASDAIIAAAARRRDHSVDDFLIAFAISAGSLIGSMDLPVMTQANQTSKSV